MLGAIVGLGYLGITKYVQVVYGQSSVSVTDTTNGVGASGQQVLALLGKLKAIQLDNEIFSDPTFQSLQDFSIEIAPQPIGRSNPFLPVGFANTSVSKPTH